MPAWRWAAMGNLFGRKKQSRVTEQDKAILVRGHGGRREGQGLGRAFGGGNRGKGGARDPRACRGVRARGCLSFPRGLGPWTGPPVDACVSSGKQRGRGAPQPAPDPRERPVLPLASEP